MALLLGGCELETRAVLDLASDGSGRVAVEVRMDEQLVAVLDDLEVDPTAELTTAVADDPAWQLERAVEDEGLVVRAVRDEVDDPAAALAELSEGLTDGDPGLLIDLDIDVDVEGRVSVQGSAELRPPAAPGALDGDGEPLGPDAEELRERTEEHVHARLEIAMPGHVVEHDADEASGPTMHWSLPPGEQIPVRAVSEPRAVTPEMLWLAGGVLTLAAAAAAAALWWRRR